MHGPINITVFNMYYFSLIVVYLPNRNFSQNITFWLKFHNPEDGYEWPKHVGGHHARKLLS